MQTRVARQASGRRRQHPCRGRARRGGEGDGKCELRLGYPARWRAGTAGAHWCPSRGGPDGPTAWVLGATEQVRPGGYWHPARRGGAIGGESKVTQGSRIHDVVAVHRLSVLNDTYYKNILCEYGGMLAIANRSDAIHKTPWIGFQSWRAAGRKVSLSLEAEKALEEVLYTETRGDVFYYWARTDLESRDTKENNIPEFWSICDVLNNGHCRDMFEDAFRLMYALPNDISALPPMPATGHWSALNSWVMPTQSFLEFIMFSRIFVDSLDSLNGNSSIQNPCLLGSSKLEKTHCYCRVLELLVNVWAYHSARKMVYLNPVSGELEEQHPIMQRKGLMWVKYFNFTLLKSMDEDLAEATVDQLYPRKNFLWPLTGEVYCPLILEREREYRYRLKMDKRRKDKEKQIERKRAGRSQKPLG
ncbi:hypothetical protein Taro_016658 [Colocasia esculenta]|uniref:Uncharacterized protein n=1 Tax=Colocasia esculenta TaxID=4460 RepID=A0A843UEA9_COLES|nr:hypothetical protein [Colocasia esculenta]